MKPAAFALLALLGLLALCACVSQAATSDYSLSSVSPPKVSLDLASVAGATVFDISIIQPDGGYPVNATLDVGSFSFPFYNQTITQFTLNFEGFLSFGDTSGDLSTAIKGSIIPRLDYGCPFPLNTTDGLPAFTRGFAWAWSDYDWSLLDATLAYKVFAAGSCPFAPKAAESCLVIQSTSTPYFSGAGVPPTGLGTVTAFVFSSGDFLVQVNSTVNSTWGHGGGDPKGVVFGIQDASLNKGVTYPSAQSCNVTNTFSTWEDISAATGIEAGDTFGFYITAPCSGSQIVRPNGIGCYTKPSSTSAAGKQASAAWVNALAALF